LKFVFIYYNLVVSFVSMRSPTHSLTMRIKHLKHETSGNPIEIDMIGSTNLIKIDS